MVLSVPIHLQDDPDLCALACVQMVIKFLAPTKKLLDQGAMVTTMGPVWATTPNQLRNAMNSRLPKGVNKFKVYSKATAAEAMAQVEAALAKGWPSVVLTHSGGHWVVATGVTTGNATRTVHSRNPAPDRALVDTVRGDGSLPPHTDTDACETLNVQTGGAPADEVAVWSAWLDTYFTACTVQGAWKGKYVVVAPDLPPVAITKLVAPVMAPLGRPLSLSSVGPLVVAGLGSSGLLALPDWRAAIKAVSPASVRGMLHVERPDGGAPYLLVDFTNGRGTGVLAALDAATGALRGARLNPARHVQRLFDAPGRGHVRFVWQPSEHSFFSPFFPFAEQVVGGRTVYIRLFDRRQFSSLAKRAVTPRGGRLFRRRT